MEIREMKDKGGLAKFIATSGPLQEPADNSDFMDLLGGWKPDPDSGPPVMYILGCRTTIRDGKLDIEGSEQEQQAVKDWLRKFADG
jgi:hypothetical protein